MASEQVKLILVCFSSNVDRLHTKLQKIYKVKWTRNQSKEICNVPSTAGRFAKNATKAGGVAFRISSNAFVPELVTGNWIRQSNQSRG